jgi:serine/threonine protein kinase
MGDGQSKSRGNTVASVMIADRYELLDVLGRGAMGQVWRARDTRFNRQVAVKIVKPNASTPTDLHRAIRRFEREVRAIGTLSHRNIAAAYDAGRDGERMYLVTELVIGRSVAAVLRGRIEDGLGPLPIPAALEIAEQICAGLHVAHQAGIVHRDLKPANLMLGDNGDVKIIDFGIVMLQEADASRLTLPGTTVGTLAYAAPEQLEGKAVDGRTDLYALGCVIYELIAGVRPFAADRAEVLLRQRMAGEVAWLHERRPETPTAVTHLVAQLMQRNPAARPATADDVRTRLRDILALSHIHS